MKKLSDLLNDEFVIRYFAENILLKIGKINIDNTYDQGEYKTLIYKFTDFPNKKLEILGYIQLNQDMRSSYNNKELISFIEKKSDSNLTNLNVAYKFQRVLDRILNDESRFVFDNLLRISWNDKNKINEDNFLKIFDFNLGKNNKTLTDVYYFSKEHPEYNFIEDNISWRKYLSKVFFSTFSDNDCGTNEFHSDLKKFINFLESRNYHLPKFN